MSNRPARLSNIRHYRIGTVSFLNAGPLNYGLEREEGIELVPDVPSRLLAGLQSGRFDIALLPAIDYQRMDGLRLLQAGAIGSDGPALTVRIFSRVPMEQIEALACDTDSHTSVALARIILAERFGIRPAFVDLAAPAGREAILLIGDKVICEPPRGFAHDIDLGQEWKQLTGRPFVFAAWMARSDVPETRRIEARLRQALEEGVSNLDDIIERFAVPRGWPAELAGEYLTRFMDYRLGPPQIEAMRHFYTLAARHGLIEPIRPL